ncbi:MAG: RNA 2'-phosphotransferase, partial [Lacticaseibacillus paracasei]
MVLLKNAVSSFSLLVKVKGCKRERTMMDKRLVKISKTLSMLLRHHPEKLGLVLDQ